MVNFNHSVRSLSFAHSEEGKIEKSNENSLSNSQTLTKFLPDFSSAPQISSQALPKPRASFLDSASLEEIESILSTQETLIEKEFSLLEKKKKSKQIVETVINYEKLAINYLNIANIAIYEGLGFLDNLFPYSLIEKYQLQPQLDSMHYRNDLADFFLTNLSSGSQGLAFIYKKKILQESKILLNQLKEKYESYTNSSSVSQEELSDMKKALQEWEAHLIIEEEALAENFPINFVNAVRNFFKVSTLPLSFFNSIPSQIKLFFSTSVSRIVPALAVCLSALNLRKIYKNKLTLNQWVTDFQTWQKNHQFIYQLPSEEQTAPTELLTCQHSSKPSPVDSSVDFQSALDETIKTSQDLLAKRQAIAKKKFLLLRPQFQELEPEIRKMKRTAFISTMQQVDQNILSLRCSPQKIRQQLEKYGLTNETHEKLFSNLQQLESDIQTLHEKGEMIVKTVGKAQDKKSQRNFLNALKQTELQLRRQFANEFQEWFDDSFAVNEHFQAYYQKQLEDKDHLLNSYIDHQETLEQTTKNALKEMINKKHEMENQFLNFKYRQNAIELASAIAAFVISSLIMIIGFLSFPVAGAGLILYLLFTGTLAVSLGLTGAKHIQARKKTATALSSLGLKVKILWASLRRSIQNYSQQIKEKKRAKLAEIVKNLHTYLITQKDNDPEYKIKEIEFQKAYSAYKEAKARFEEGEAKVEQWNIRLQRLNHLLTQKGWRDFAEYASLQVSENEQLFDTLQQINETLPACNLQLLDEETKNLFKVQLGLDLESLQKQMVTIDPEIIKKTLQKFFLLDDAGLLAFIKKQKAYIDVKLLSPQAI